MTNEQIEITPRRKIFSLFYTLIFAMVAIYCGNLVFTFIHYPLSNIIYSILAVLIGLFITIFLGRLPLIELILILLYPPLIIGVVQNHILQYIISYSVLNVLIYYMIGSLIGISLYKFLKMNKISEKLNFKDNSIVLSNARISSNQTILNKIITSKEFIGLLFNIIIYLCFIFYDASSIRYFTIVSFPLFFLFGFLMSLSYGIIPVTILIVTIFVQLNETFSFVLFSPLAADLKYEYIFLIINLVIIIFCGAILGKPLYCLIKKRCA